MSVEERIAAARREGYAAGRAEALNWAADFLAEMWDDGEQGPPREEIERYAEIVLIRDEARRALDAGDAHGEGGGPK